MTPLSLVPAPAEPRSPLRATALVAFAIFALGTTGYALCVPSWSGRRVASFDVKQERTLALPGLTVTRTGPRAHRVGPVRLDPAMSPARVLAHVRYQPQPGRPISCRVTMRDAGGRPVWSENRALGSSAAGPAGRGEAGTTLLVETFDVARAGEYDFIVDVGARGSDVIHGVRLEVRRQVASVQAWFVVLGALLALGSLVVVLLAGPRFARAERRHSRAA